MPLRVVCSFCGNPVEPGTGLMFVSNDNQRFYFCSRKCERSLVRLGRKARKLKWTAHFERGPSPPPQQKPELPEAGAASQNERKRGARADKSRPAEEKPAEGKEQPSNETAHGDELKPEGE